MKSATMKTTILTQYESERDQRVQRNNMLMAKLGISSLDVLMHEKFAKKKNEKKKNEKKRPIGEGDAEEANRAKKRKSTRQRKNGAAQNCAEASAAEFADSALVYPKATVKTMKERDEEVAFDEKHSMAKLEHEKRYRNEDERKKRATMIGTASYAHTLMRVKTMTEPNLKKRIESIARARGQHCVVKMRLFARVLYLEGYEELAQEAGEVLQGLISEFGDTGEDETQDVEEEEEEEGEEE